MELKCDNFYTSGECIPEPSVQRVELNTLVDKFANGSIVSARFNVNRTLVKRDYEWLKRLIETNPLIMLGKQ